MAEGREDIVQRGPMTVVSCRPGEDERQVSKVRRGFFQFGKPPDADNCGNRLVAPRDDEIRSLLCVGDQSGDAALGGFGHRDLTRFIQDGHTLTIQKSV